MKTLVQYGTTSKKVYFKVKDTSGNGVTGLTYSDFTITTFVNGDTAEATQTLNGTNTALDDTYTENSILEVGTGKYQYCVPDDVFVTIGASFVTIVTSGYPDIDFEFQVTGIDVEDEIRFGATALPYSAQAGAGGLPIKTDLTGTSEIFSTDLSTYTTEGTAGYHIKMAQDLESILGVTLTETASGYLAASLAYFLDVATPSKTVNDVGVAGTALTTAEIVTAMDGTSQIATDTTQIAALIADVGDGDQFTETALALAPSGTSTGATAEEVWTYATKEVTGGTIDTCTTNTDMRGTDDGATEAKQDIIDTNVDSILVDTGTDIPALIAALNDFDWDSAETLDGELLKEAVTLMRAVLLGISTESGTTFRDKDNTLNRVVASVDTSYNRDSVTTIVTEV